MDKINRSKKSENKRLVILNSAQKVFSKKGFLSVSMQDIIDEGHISRGGIYIYFSSIDEIFFETITKRSIRQFDDIRLAIQDNPPFYELLNNYLLEHKKRLVNHVNNDYSLLRAMYEYSFTHNSERDKKLKQKQINATRATVRSVLDIGVRQHKISQDKVKVISDTFMLLIEGMNILALTGNLKEKQIDEQFDLFYQKITNKDDEYVARD